MKQTKLHVTSYCVYHTVSLFEKFYIQLSLPIPIFVIPITFKKHHPLKFEDTQIFKCSVLETPER